MWPAAAPLRHSSPFAAVLLFAAIAAASTPPNLAYLDLGPGGTACCLVPDAASGRVYAVGAVARDFATDVSVTTLDANNRILSSFQFGGSGADRPASAALDPQGNLVIVGGTFSSDFPLASPLIPQTEPRAQAGFVTRVNPATGEILFSTRIGGQAADPLGIGSGVRAVALDPAGNIYIGGWTNSPDFPVSSGAFLKAGPGRGALPTPFGFAMKISAAGDRIVYSTLLGGRIVACSGGSHCVPKTADTSVAAIAVDPNGIATVGGSTNALDFPTTAGAFQIVCRCREFAGNAFVTRLNADASGLVWSTFLGGAWYGDPMAPRGTQTVAALALDGDGNTTVVGQTDAIDFPTTAGVVQPHYNGSAAGTLVARPSDAFVSRLSSDGTALVWSTYLGGTQSDQAGDVQLDAQGNVWITGASQSADLFGGVPFAGSFVARLSSDGARFLQTQSAPGHAAGQALRQVSNGDLWALGGGGSVLQIPGARAEGVAVLGATDSAGSDVKGYVAPGEFVSLYGLSLGPSPAAGARLDDNGRVATELAGVRVLFDGVPAPLLYVSETQINVLAPFGLYGRSETAVQVIAPGGTSTEFRLHVKPAQPEVFNLAGAALALNQDGTINSPERPAAPGSIATIFASGAGFMIIVKDGDIATASLHSWPQFPVAVLMENSLEVLFAGSSPGTVVNALQVNFRLPQTGLDLGENRLTLRLMIGEFVSDPFTLYVQAL